MNSYEKAIQFGLTGDDAAIVSTLKNSGLTHTKIEVSKLLYVLNDRNMLVHLAYRTEDGQDWSGCVIEMIKFVNKFADDDSKKAINKWFSHITTDRNEYFNTTDMKNSVPFWSMRQNFGGKTNMPTVEDFDAIAELGNGWAFKDLDEAQYLLDKEQYIRNTEAISLYNMIRSRVNKWDELSASIRTRIESNVLFNNSMILDAINSEIGE